MEFSEEQLNSYRKAQKNFSVIFFFENAGYVLGEIPGGSSRRMLGGNSGGILDEFSEAVRDTTKISSRHKNLAVTVSKQVIEELKKMRQKSPK